jgi:hypothetical protein
MRTLILSKSKAHSLLKSKLKMKMRQLIESFPQMKKSSKGKKVRHGKR